MRKSAAFALMLSLAMLWGCSHTVVVPVPPRVDLQSYGTLGIVELGTPDSLLAAVGSRQLDAQALRRIVASADRRRGQLCTVCNPPAVHL